ncbi:MAG: hypothetical protein ACK4N5_26480, partial [Myxococcales bacterium]
ELPDPRGGFEGPLEATLRARDVPFAFLARLAQTELPDGAVPAGAQVGGTVHAPRLDLAVDAGFALVEAGEEKRARFELEAGVGERLIELRTALRMEDAPPATVAGTLKASRPGPIWSQEGLLAAVADVRVNIASLDLDRLARAGLLPPGTGGRVEGRAHFTGPVALFDLVGDLQLTAFTLPETGRLRLPPADVRIDLDARKQAVTATVDALLKGAPRFTADVHVGHSLARLMREERPEKAPLRAKVRLEPGPVDMPEVGLRAELLELAGEVTGTLGKPRAQLIGRAQALLVGEDAVGDAHLAFAGGPDAWDAGVDLAPAQGGALSIAATNDRSGWRARLDAEQARLDFLQALPAVGA